MTGTSDGKLYLIQNEMRRPVIGAADYWNVCAKDDIGILVTGRIQKHYGLSELCN